jgi:hypothetical protein
MTRDCGGGTTACGHGQLELDLAVVSAPEPKRKSPDLPGDLARPVERCHGGGELEFDHHDV